MSPSPAWEARNRRALTEVGLEHRAEVPAATLSHGEQRQLEIAMTLATRPRILLLDEPLAGMGGEESARADGGGAGAPRGSAGRNAVARRAAPARDCDDARHPPAHPAAR